MPRASVFIQPVARSASSDVEAASIQGCTGRLRLPLAATTSTDGRFAAEFEGGGPPVLSCIIVQGTAPTAAGIVNAFAKVDSVVLGPTGLDSLEIHVILPRT